MGHAVVRRVVHIVVDRVHAWERRAGIAFDAMLAGVGLVGGIIDLIPSIAAELEGVQEAEPMTNLMDSRYTMVIAYLGAAGEGCVSDSTAVIPKPLAARDCIVRRVEATSHSDVPLVPQCLEIVDVQGAVIALSQSLLHLQLVLAHSPVWVDLEGGILPVELDAYRPISLLQDPELMDQHIRLLLLISGQFRWGIRI